MRILGVSAFSNSAAAALVEDGRPVAAVREDRLLRQAGAAVYPMRAINSCLQAGDVTLGDVDFVVFHEKPFLKFARLVRDFLGTWPRSFRAAMATLPGWLEDGLIPGLALERETGIPCHSLFLKHHLSHAASAFLLSPFEEAALLTLDGVGEEASATWGLGCGSQVTIRQEMRFPNSPGFLWRALAGYLGLAPEDGDDGLADLAALGQPSQLEGLRAIVRVHQDGSFQVDHAHLPFRMGHGLYSAEFVKRFGAPRLPGQEFEQRHLDMAASLQALLEEIGVAMARHVALQTGADRLCLAGGVAGNPGLASRILREGLFEELFVPPSPGSDGAALGAALAVSCARGAARPAPLEDPFLGPGWPVAHVRRVLVNAELTVSEVQDQGAAAHHARLLQEHGAVGWFQGRLEFSSRPLGSRAVLLDPARSDLLEAWRGRSGTGQVGLAVPEERCADWFQLDRPSPFGHLAPAPLAQAQVACSGVLAGRARLPVQTVARAVSPRLWDLLEQRARDGGCPILAVLPLAQPGQPLACRPEEALEACQASGLECLVAENLVASLSRPPLSEGTVTP